MNKTIIEKIKKIPIIRVFSVTIIFSFILWGICLLTGDTNQANVFFGGQKPCDDLFMDFINPMWHSSNFLTYEFLYDYRKWMCYAPFAYYLFNIFDSLAININYTNPHLVKLLLSCSFLVFVSVSLLLLNYYNLFKVKKFDKFLFSIAILCSGIYLFAFERANVIIGVMLCIFYFVFNYRSKNKILKEIAIILLAIATIFKLSPIIFLWLLLIQKDYKSIFRFCLYSAMMLILPCLSFPRGIESLGAFADNLNLLSIHNLSIALSGQGKYYPNLLLMNLGFNFYSANTLTTIFYMFLGAFCTIALLFQKKEWKRILMLSLILILIPNVSAPYTLLYLIPVLVLYFNDREKSKSDYLYLLWFLMIFNTYQIYIGTINPGKIKEIAILAILFQLLKESVCVFKFKYIFEFIKKQIVLIKFYLNNPKQKNIFKNNIIRYLSCSILSLIILAGGCLGYYKNYTYDRYKTENIEQTHYFDTKPTTLKSDFKIDLTCVFYPKQTQTYENIFQTADGNEGIRMELSPDMTLALLYTTPLQKLEGFAINNIEPDKIYKIRSVISRKSVASILYKFSTEENKWIEVADYTIKNKINKFSVQRIIAGSGFGDERPFMGNVLSFDLKIKNGRNSNWIVIITLFAFFIPLIYAFYYKKFRKHKCF